MTELTAAEIERLRPDPWLRLGAYVTVRACELERLCDMAAASLAPAGDGEVEGLMRDLRNLHRGYDAVVAAAIGRKAADTLARQQAEIIESRRQWKNYEALARDLGNKLLGAEARATELQDELDQANATVARLRERLEKAEADGRLQADDRVLLNARVAELMRVVEGVIQRANRAGCTYVGCAVGRGVTYHSDHCPKGLATALEEALTAAQGEEPAPVTTEELDKLQFGRVLHGRPAPDHTSAIREAMGALQECVDRLEALKEDGIADAEERALDRARAAHAKLTEIIEGGGDG